MRFTIFSDMLFRARREKNERSFHEMLYGLDFRLIMARVDNWTGLANLRRTVSDSDLVDACRCALQGKLLRRVGVLDFFEEFMFQPGHIARNRECPFLDSFLVYVVHLQKNAQLRIILSRVQESRVRFIAVHFAHRILQHVRKN